MITYEDFKVSEGKLLRKARSYINRGWIKGDYKSVQLPSKTAKKAIACFCAMGALREAAKDLTGATGFYVGMGIAEEGAQLLRAANRRAISGNVPVAEEAVVLWNDRKRRTKEQVLDAFDRAIASVSKKRKK